MSTVPGESWGSKQACPVIHQPISVVSQCVADTLLKRLARSGQRQPTGSSSTLEVLRGDVLYKSTFL